jgi:membrane-bound serine protease (ClpP class)
LTVRVYPRIVRIALRLVSVIAMALGVAGMAFAADDAHTVIVGHVEGVINPITARYVDRLVDEGEERGVAALVLVIDTPGGLIDSTYKITGRMLNAGVPILTYVAPSGAHAASAGTFITLAGHVAAMAPATNIGAAHPVSGSGGDIEDDLRAKVENDAVAQIVNIARARGHNEKWAEDAVRNSVSIGADEAVSLKVVDLLATDVRDLVDRADGRQVMTSRGAVTLATKDAALEEAGPNPLETLLHLIVDPQVAVLLFTIGTYGIIFELSNPSLIFPGVIGVIAIVLALFAFGTLDANAAGIALMVFAVLLFIAEIKVASHGILTAGGIAALLIGTIIIFPPLRPTFPGVRATVDPIAIAVIVGTTGLFFLAIARLAVRAHGVFTPTGAASLLGAIGVARSDISATGIAYVGGEDWTAVSDAGPIEKGSPVRVKRVDSLRLIVEPTKELPERRGAS